MKCIRLGIKGIEEEETQDRVKNQLEGMNGVKEVQVNVADRCVEINFDDPTSDDDIYSHLQNNGYKII